MTEPPDADVAADPTPPPPRRKRNRARIAFVLVFLVVAAAAVWWRNAATGDPKLEFTAFNRVNRVENDVTGDPTVGITEKENVTGTQIDIEFVSNQRIYVYLGLRNGGSQTVRIEEAPPAGFYYFGFDTMEVSPEDSNDIGPIATYEPFKPFTLKPGQERNVRLTFRLAECSPGARQPGTTYVKGLVMRYKILGLKRAWLVPFDNSALAVPTIGGCEKPIYDPSVSVPE